MSAARTPWRLRRAEDLAGRNAELALRGEAFEQPRPAALAYRTTVPGHALRRLPGAGPDEGRKPPALPAPVS